MSNDFIKNLLNLETESDKDEDDDVVLDGHFIFQETHEEEFLDNFFEIGDTENSVFFFGDIRIQETTDETGETINIRSKDTQENEISENINIKKNKEQKSVKKVKILNEKPIQFKKKLNLGRRKKELFLTVLPRHSKNRKDNRKNKIKTQFFNFLIDFTNGIVKGDLIRIYNIKFMSIIHSEKSNIRINDNKHVFNHKKIRDMFNLKISQKYKGVEPYENLISLEKLMNRVQQNPIKTEILNNFFDLPLEEFYENYYLSLAPEEILFKYKIKKGKKCKIKFFFELIEEMKKKKIDQLYVKELTKEGNDFVSEFKTKISRQKICNKQNFD